MRDFNKQGQPVAAYRRLLDRESIPFISRENMILEMREHLNNVFANRGRTVMVIGESGIGKTRLVDQFINSLDPSDIIVLKIRIFGSISKPYEPFSSIIRYYFDAIENKSNMLTHLMPMEIASVILSLLPNLRSWYPVEVQSKPYSDQDICSAINQLLENMSRLKPVVIFLDDLQLISPRAKKIIQFIHERIDDKAIFIIGCFTAQEKNKKEKRIVFFSGKNKVHEIKLNSFTADETGLFINSIFEQDFSPSLNKWMFRITRGNPYFIKEFIKEIVSQNILIFSERSQKWNIEKGYQSTKVPESINTIFQVRIHKLDQAALSFLHVAALIGEQFEPDMVRSVLKLSESDAVKIQARLAQEFFSPVMRTNYMQFTHPVEREILCKNISEQEQRSFHRQLAKVFKKKKPLDCESIARHATALLNEEEKTPELCRTVFNASKHLADTGDLAEAHKYCTIAMEIANTLGARFQLAQNIIEARLITLTMSLKHMIPDQKRATEIANRLLHHGMARIAIHLHIMIYRYLYAQTSFQKAAKYVAKVIRAVPKTKDNESVLFRLKIEQSMVWRYIGKIVSARRLIRRLLKKYSLNTDFNAYCYGLNIIGLIYYREGNLKTACKYFQQLVNIAEKLNYVPMKAVALVNLNAASSKMGAIEYARDLTQQYQQLILRTGQEYKMSIYWGSMAYCAFFEGHLEEALQYFKKALENPITSYSEFSSNYIKAEVLIHMGRLDEAYEIFKKYPTDQPEPPAQEEWLAYAHTVHAQYHLKLGYSTKAMQSINKAIDIADMNGLGIELGVAHIVKGIIQKTNNRKKDGLINIKSGIEILDDKGAKSYLAPLLCEAGLVFNDQEWFDRGMEVLGDIGSYGWIRKFHKRAMESDVQIKPNNLVSIERLRINTFGGLAVISSGYSGTIAPNQWKSAKARELLGLFLVNTGSRGATWGEFALHLWPDFGTKTARNNFHFTLSTLRDTIGEQYIIHENNFYRLDKSKIQIDIWDFEELHIKFRQYRAQNKIHLADRCARNALKLMSGDFLPEFYNEAIQAKRTEIKNKSEDFLMYMANRCIEKHEFQEAIRLAYKIVEKDPVSEVAHEIIIRSYVELGERARALRQYERFTTILRQDFGLEPGIDIKNLIEQLKPDNIA